MVLFSLFLLAAAELSSAPPSQKLEPQTTVGRIVARCRVSDEGRLSECQALSEEGTLSASNRQTLAIAVAMTRVSPQGIANAKAHGGYLIIPFKLVDDPNPNQIDLREYATFLAQVRHWNLVIRLPDRVVYQEVANKDGTVSDPKPIGAWTLSIYYKANIINGHSNSMSIDGESYDCSKRTVRLNLRRNFDDETNYLSDDFVGELEPVQSEWVGAAKLKSVCDNQASGEKFDASINEIKKNFPVSASTIGVSNLKIFEPDGK